MKYEILLFLTTFIPFKRLRKTSRMSMQKMKPNLCYSQEGEDMILKRMFGNQKSGFYVDVGAHHPFCFSNTALFYQRKEAGWSGINIDPLPGNKILFDKYRPRDINLEIGVAECSGKLTYYMFGEPAYNTFDKQLAESRTRAGWALHGKKDISVLPLSEILAEHLPEGRSIDLMTIDVEGLDLEVIRSNDWQKYAPRVVVIEALDCRTVNDTLSSPPVCFLKQHEYEVVAKTKNSVVLEKKTVMEKAL